MSWIVVSGDLGPRGASHAGRRPEGSSRRRMLWRWTSRVRLRVCARPALRGRADGPSFMRGPGRARRQNQKQGMRERSPERDLHRSGDRIVPDGRGEARTAVRPRDECRPGRAYVVRDDCRRSRDELRPSPSRNGQLRSGAEGTQPLADGRFRVHVYAGKDAITARAAGCPSTPTAPSASEERPQSR